MKSKISNWKVSLLLVHCSSLLLLLVLFQSLSSVSATRPSLLSTLAVRSVIHVPSLTSLRIFSFDLVVDNRQRIMDCNVLTCCCSCLVIPYSTCSLLAFVGSCWLEALFLTYWNQVLWKNLTLQSLLEKC